MLFLLLYTTSFLIFILGSPISFYMTISISSFLSVMANLHPPSSSPRLHPASHSCSRPQSHDRDSPRRGSWHGISARPRSWHPSTQTHPSRRARRTSAPPGRLGKHGVSQRHLGRRRIVSSALQCGRRRRRRQIGAGPRRWGWRRRRRCLRRHRRCGSIPVRGVSYLRWGGKVSCLLRVYGIAAAAGFTNLRLIAPHARFIFCSKLYRRGVVLVRTSSPTYQLRFWPRF